MAVPVQWTFCYTFSPFNLQSKNITRPMLRCYGEREYTITVDRSFVSPALRTHSQDTFVTLKRVV